MTLLTRVRAPGLGTYGLFALAMGLAVGAGSGFTSLTFRSGPHHSAGAGPPADSAAVAEAVDRFHRALAAGDSAAVTVGSAATIPVLANDNDPDGDPIEIIGIDAPTHGTITVQPDGSIRYDPATLALIDALAPGVLPRRAVIGAWRERP